MSVLVIDASIAIKWVIDEPGTSEALALRDKATLIAPDLLVPECANILWKKVGRKELSRDEALLAARLLQVADLEIVSTRELLEPATRIAIDLNHPAYDCLYVALAISRSGRFVTADEAFARKVARHGKGFREWVMSLAEAAAPP